MGSLVFVKKKIQVVRKYADYRIQLYLLIINNLYGIGVLPELSNIKYLFLFRDPPFFYPPINVIKYFYV